MQLREIRVDPWFAERLPPPGERAFDALVEDIRMRGILVDLLVSKDGLLLDGHRRLEAARRLGINDVPVKILEFAGEESWEATVAITVNLFRRQLTEVQRACLGSSLLRIEREKAKERQMAGQEKGRDNRRKKNGAVVLDGDHPLPARKIRATEKVAEAVGINRQTLERVEAVKRGDPEIARQLVHGELSVAAAYRQMKGKAALRRAKEGDKETQSPGLITDLAAVAGKYRTVYMDAPWPNQATDPAECLASIPLKTLAQTEGCHFWMWASWPAIRHGVVHRLLKSWGIRWVAELQWDRGAKGKGRWFHKRTEVLLLGTAGDLQLLNHEIQSVYEAEQGASKRPNIFRKLIEMVSPGPRLELFGKVMTDGWDLWQGR